MRKHFTNSLNKRHANLIDNLLFGRSTAIFREFEHRRLEVALFFVGDGLNNNILFITNCNLQSTIRQLF